jgi:hypothetical protein
MGLCIARNGIGLVYGGAKVGLMGILADTVLAEGGQVIGVMPVASIAEEIAHSGLTELRIVNSFAERKALMAELSNAFVVMPGGFGTLDELSEMVTWTQIGLHRKRCGLLNVEGFYDSLLSFLDHATTQGFISQEHRSIVLSDKNPERLLVKLIDPEPSPAAQVD